MLAGSLLMSCGGGRHDAGFFSIGDPYPAQRG